MTVPVPNIFETFGDQCPTIMAPLSGITDVAFRRLCVRYGCRFAYTEMASADALAYDNTKAHERLDGLDQEVPTVAQLLGRDPDLMAAAAELCEARGASAVDVNLGCPAKRIVRGGGGSALMRDPDLVARIVTAIFTRIRIPVSVKMRAGWDDQCRNAVEVAQVAVDSGAAAVTVHPRTRTQAFKGEARWEVIGRVKEAVSVPVYGNGDVRTAADAHRMKSETGCDGVMVGRAALGRPWVYGQMDSGEESEPDFDQRLAIALEHLDLLVEHKGRRGVIEFRKHLACYLKSMPCNKFVREKMGRMEEAHQVAEVLDAYREHIQRHGSSEHG